MQQNLYRGLLPIGMFISVCSIIMLFVQPPNSAEYVISFCSAIIGGLLIIAVLMVGQLLNRL